MASAPPSPLPPGQTTSVLFVCTSNTIRSPIAAALLKRYRRRRVHVDSIGVQPGDPDPFAVAVMAEVGLDLSRHAAKGFEALEDEYFDLVVTLSPQARARAADLARRTACALETWEVPDPTLTEGNREAMLTAYREVRDLLSRRIEERFRSV